MQRKKRLTKRERKDQTPSGGGQQHAAHIHCIACGRHLDPAEFSATPATAKYLICDHQSRFPACADCDVVARGLIAEHDRTGKPIAQAQAWH